MYSSSSEPSRRTRFFTLMVSVCWCGFSTSCLARVPGAVLLVSTTLFLGLRHHCTNSSREKPHSMSAMLASTTLGSGTRASSARPWQSWRCRNWNGLLRAPSKERITLSLIHST
uniref:Putative secreted protein n=1 Tax=Ixodes ricinus TaxID=34613 RepID=A0A6B0UKC4_IXORI